MDDHVHTGYCNHGSCDEPTGSFKIPPGATRVDIQVQVVPVDRKAVGEAVEEFGRAVQRLVDEINALLRDIFGQDTSWPAKLREAGLIPEVPPDDPWERALWVAQHRNTGPARPSGQNARRPRKDI